MRIVGGAWKGRPLEGPRKLQGVRPTADRVREALFSILVSKGWAPDGCRVLDLFAGTGALGLEALSRGAEAATFVENNARARALLARNIALFEAASVQVLTMDATRLGQNTGAPFDLVFADPPYGKGLAEKALVAAQNGRWIEQDALVVVEESDSVAWPEGFTPVDARRYGDTRLQIASMVAEAPGGD